MGILDNIARKAGVLATMLVTGTLFSLRWRQSPDANRAATALGQQLAAHKARGRLASGKAPNITESTVFPCFPESIPSPSSCVFDMSARENVTVAVLVCMFFYFSFSSADRLEGVSHSNERQKQQWDEHSSACWYVQPAAPVLQ
jgi:hypothetical protein